jgi:hypothetical protein
VLTGCLQLDVVVNTDQSTPEEASYEVTRTVRALP